MSEAINPVNVHTSHDCPHYQIQRKTWDQLHAKYQWRLVEGTNCLETAKHRLAMQRERFPQSHYRLVEILDDSPPKE